MLTRTLARVVMQRGAVLSRALGCSPAVWAPRLPPSTAAAAAPAARLTTSLAQGWSALAPRARKFSGPLVVAPGPQESADKEVFGESAVLGGFDLEESEYEGSRRSVPPPPGTYGSLDDANARLIMLQQMPLNSETRLSLSSATYDDMRLDNIRPNFTTYSTLITSALKCDHLGETLRYFDAMRYAGIKPTLPVYNAVLTQLAKSGQLDASFKLVEQMQREGTAANVRTYCILMIACSIGNDSPRAFKLFESMMAAGISMNVFIYSALINVCRGSGQLDRAKQFYEAAKLHSPTVSMTNCIIETALELGDMNAAQAYYDEMTSLQLTPNSATYVLMFKAYMLYDRTDAAMTLYDSVQPHELHRTCYDFLLRLFANSDKPIESAQRFLADLRADGRVPYVKSMHAFVVACSTRSTPQRNVELWQTVKGLLLTLGSLRYLALRVPAHSQAHKEILEEIEKCSKARNVATESPSEQAANLAIE